VSIASPSSTVHTIPSSDHAFRQVVGQAVAAVTGTTRYEVGQEIQATERVVRMAFVGIRRRYPDAALRRQDPLATVEGRTRLYVFRDGV
jgi:hypothetical protein